MKTRITVCILLLSVIVISCNDNSIKPIYDTASLPDEYKIEMIRIPQNDNYSCATTSLATLITYYMKLTEPLNKDAVWDISQTKITDVRTHGNDITGLDRISEFYNYKHSFMKKMSFNDLRYYISRNIPVIIFIKFDNSFTHALVVNGYSKSKKCFYIVDPSVDETVMSEEFLLNHWEAWLSKPRIKSKQAGYIIEKP